MRQCCLDRWRSGSGSRQSLSLPRPITALQRSNVRDIASPGGNSGCLVMVSVSVMTGSAAYSQFNRFPPWSSTFLAGSIDHDHRVTHDNHAAMRGHAAHVGGGMALKHYRECAQHDDFGGADA